jgi:hypothetical protein
LGVVLGCRNSAGDAGGKLEVPHISNCKCKGRTLDCDSLGTGVGSYFLSVEIMFWGVVSCSVDFFKSARRCIDDFARLKFDRRAAFALCDW